MESTITLWNHQDNIMEQTQLCFNMITLRITGIFAIPVINGRMKTYLQVVFYYQYFNSIAFRFREYQSLTCPDVHGKGVTSWLRLYHSYCADEYL
jgi:hypothetical protein